MDLTVVITGGTRGIGRAVVTEFVEAGAFVAFCGRDKAGVETVQSDLTDREGVVWGTKADVRDEYDIERFLEQATRKGGQLDIVIPNAAVSHDPPGETPLHEVDHDVFENTMRTNTKGVFTTAKEAVPHLAEEGRILVPSGSVASGVVDGMGAYAVSKAGAEAVARGLAGDLDQAVGVLDPGLVATELTGNDRARDPERVAPMFTWAATDCSAEELNGQRIGLREWRKATR